MDLIIAIALLHAAGSHCKYSKASLIVVIFVEGTLPEAVQVYALHSTATLPSRLARSKRCALGGSPMLRGTSSSSSIPKSRLRTRFASLLKATPRLTFVRFNDSTMTQARTRDRCLASGMTVVGGASANSGWSGGPVDSTVTVVLLVYSNAFEYLKMGFASAMSFVLFIVIGLITIINARLLRYDVGY